MPMADEELFGTNADGSKNEDYCIYCFKDGEFTSDMDKEQASAMMGEVFPKLKRWAND